MDDLPKRKGRPKGVKDRPGIRSDLPLEERLKICKELIKDKSLSSKERLDAIRLYSELQGDKKKDGFEQVKLVFSVVPDRVIPPQFNGDALNKQVEAVESSITDNLVNNTISKAIPVIIVPRAIKEEPLIAPQIPTPVPKTPDEIWDDAMAERDKSIAKQQNKFINGN